MTAFADVRAWTKAVIEAVDDFNVVFDTVRIIQDDAQLEEDFGTGTTPAGELQERTHGWTIMMTGIEPEELDTWHGLDGYGLELTCYSSVHSRGASEAAFDDHVSAVRLALGADLRPDSIPNVYDVSIIPVELALVEFPRFGGRLHHRAIVRLTVRIERPLRS